MPMFEGDPAGLLWEATAVPNGFMMEYMPAAPDGYVKVYLYGLVYARHCESAEGLTLEQVSKDLCMEAKEVFAAMQYWERCRLVARTQDSPPRYRYLSVQQALMGRQAAPPDEGYMEFGQALYAIFGDKRRLHGSETSLAYEWVEQLGLPKEVVLMMVQHLVSTRGIQFGFKEAQKLAVELKEQSVTTIDAAEQLFSRSEAAWKGTRKVLRRMGKYRAPSMDETDLFLKWTKEWGFAPKAIEAACQEMTRGDPNFAYLDAILKGLMERRGKAAETGDEVTRQLTDEKQENEQIKEMLSAFGLSSKLTDTVKAEYAEMRRYQPHEVIVLAAGIVSKRKSRSLDEVTALARSWSEKGLHDLPSVRAYLHALSEQNALLRALLEASGADPRPTAPGRELLQKWTEEWRFSREVLLLAAGYAQNAQKPLPFMDKMLEGWHNAGVQTVENAVAERERHAQSAPPSSSASAASPRPMKTVREQQYDQREYDPAEFDGLTPEELKEIEQYEP